MIQSGFSWYSRWDVNAGPSFLTPSLSKAGANVTVDNVACNLARLVSRMAGDNLLAITSSNSTAAPAPATPPSILNATVAISSNGTLRILAFHHHPWLNATEVPGIAPGEVKVEVCGFEKAYGPGALDMHGTVWQLNDEHGQFWPAWEDDLLLANVNTSVPGNSWYQDGGGPWDRFQDTRGYDVWLSRVAHYRELAKLRPAPALHEADMRAGCFALSVALAPHSVALFEYETKWHATGSKTDDDANSAAARVQPLRLATFSRGRRNFLEPL